MIVEYIRYYLAEPAREAFEQAYAAAAPLLDESPYCLGYELAVCAEDPGQYILRVTWTSAEDHLEGFRKSTGFRPFFAAIRPYVDAIQEMRHYTLTAVHNDKAGAKPV
jgi:quinol monooxygenase YgiN